METARGKSRDEIINKLADRIDSFEKYPHPHSRLMAEAAERLARRLGLSPADTEAVRQAALLHDIGLYAMSPSYHSQPGALSIEQRIDLWRHPIIGEQQMAKRNASRHAKLLVRWHHEWWNGSGYPDGLAGEDIPIGARIIRAVELLSALTSSRPYRNAMSEDAALETLKASAGIECDPIVVSALVELVEEAIAKDLEIQAASAEPGPAIEAPPGERPYFEQAPRPESTQQEPGAGEGASAERRGALSYNDGGQAPASFEAGPVTPEESKGDSTFGSAETSAASTRSPQTDSQTASAAEQSVQSMGLRAVAPDSSKRRSFSIDLLVFGAAREAGDADERWRSWASSSYNAKALLGFEASVLRQLEFRSIAVGLCGWARLEFYLKTWGKLILSNDPRSWAAAASRAAVEARVPLGEDQIAEILRDVYVPGARLSNPALRDWFGETDAWWLDNLRANIEAIQDETVRVQALVLGLQTGDYALSFGEATLELRRPLTTVFWQLAGRYFLGPPAQPQSRSLNEPIADFVRRARAEALYLVLPPSHGAEGGSQARSRWRESWVTGASLPSAAGSLWPGPAPQSKQAYLSSVNRLLASAAHFKTWAIGYQDTGLASASDIVELIKEHRAVSATYSKDLTEVAGGLRNYIIVADRK